MHPNALQTPITYLKGVGPGRAALIGRELGVQTYQDLLYLFPNRYIDKSRFYKISELERSGAEVHIIGRISKMLRVSFI
jgi:ATP-dependent DNA helicase RecG